MPARRLGRHARGPSPVATADRLPIEARKRAGTGRSLNSRRWWPFSEGTWGGAGVEGGGARGVARC